MSVTSIPLYIIELINNNLLKLLEPSNVFAQYVELKVDLGAHLDGAEVGVLHGVGDDGHLEGALGGVAYGE